jgi:hypothetical protein
MSNIISFINHVGQSIVGERVEESGDNLLVKNPAVLHVTPNQTGQLQVQLIPLLFREFVAPDKRNEGVTFTFNKKNLVTSDAVLDARIEEQYTRIATAVSAPQKPADSKDAPVIKLFDD